MLIQKHERVELVTRAEILRGLEQLGVRQGDALVVHCSLSSFGYVDGGVGALLAALLAALGPAGTLMAPTMTFMHCCLPSRLPQPYDPDSTPCDQAMGVLAEAVRLHPQALRSGHPLVSVAAIGPLAAELTSAQTFAEPYAPYRRMAELGGQILLLGVGHSRNSTVHAAEYLAGLPHATGNSRLPWYALINTPMGGEQIILGSVAGCSEGFSRLDERLPERRGLIGASQARLMYGRDLIAAALELWRAEPLPFLCADAECGWCTLQRAELEP